MNRWFLFFGFTALLCLFIAGEFFLNPPKVFRFTPKSEEKDAPLFSTFPITIFSENGISNIRTLEQKEVKHFFHEVPLYPDSSKIRVLRTVFVKKENDNETPFFVLYEFFSSQETTVLSVYLEIKEALKNALSSDPESDINENNTYGDMSFYENLGNDKKTVYLVVAFEDGIYGFEYPKANHLQMKRLYESLFSRS